MGVKLFIMNKLGKNIKYLVTSGCSHTYGYDLEENNPLPPEEHSEQRAQQRYSRLVANYYGIEDHNLSLNGIGNKFITRSVLAWFSRNPDKISQTYVIVQWSYSDRIEHWSVVQDGYTNWDKDHDGFSDCIKSNPDILKTKSNETWNGMQIQNEWALQSILELQNFCKAQKIPYLFFNSDLDGPSVYFKDFGNVKHADAGYYSKHQYTNFVNLIDFDNFFLEEGFAQYCKNNKLCVTSTFNQKTQLYEPGHPSSDGHQVWANNLISLIDTGKSKLNEI